MIDTFTPMVREYTETEREAMDFDPSATPEKKAARLISSHFIDIERYQEAIVAHPEKRDHFNHLITASQDYYQGILGHMITDGRIEAADYPEISVCTTVPYVGAEEQIIVTLNQPTPQELAEVRWLLPA